MSWPCFWTEPTGEAELGLRRYVSRSDAGGWTCETGWHDAMVWLGEQRPYLPVQHEDGHPSYPLASDVLRVRKNDRRWPKTCDRCDYRFTADDPKQVWAEALYRRIDNGERRVWHHRIGPPGIPTVEPGAMRDAWWLHGFTSMLNPDRPKDGVVLSVLCPYMTGGHGGWDWSPDMQASSGGYWTRTGDPRRPKTLTVNPSIAIGPPSDPRYYHGFLRAGVLTDHVG
jgi:hypothetical protein